MLATLVAALSLASPGAIEVPFVPQSDALCGGAAAAMVFRYWGDAHANAEQFLTLVVRRQGTGAGIADDDLTAAIRARGWRVERTNGSLTWLRERVAARQPVIVLLAEPRNRYHYVVVVGARDDGVVVHDPSRGPFRLIQPAEFSRLWAASRRWSLVVLPSEASATASNEPAADPPSVLSPDRCEQAVRGAVDEVSARGLDHADEVLGPIRAECPQSAAPLRELAGVRFGQRRWSDATSFAREALELQPNDSYALDVLGASLFMQDDAVGALRAWNRIGKPRLDLVNIEGVRRARYETIVEALTLKPNTVLTADGFARAQHRLDELPDRSAARLTLRPDADGFASVDVALAERGLPHGWPEWTGAAARAAVDREVEIAVPGFSGQGDLWSASWRWWNNRPRIAFAVAAPRVSRFSGIWRVEGSWEAETYTVDRSNVRQSHASARVTISDWLTARVRYAVRSGFDGWNDGRRAGAVGGSIERRWLDDRVSTAADGTIWMPVTGGDRFSAIGAHSTLRWPRSSQRWRFLTTIGSERVSDSAPMTVWPGAGEGRARPTLLRAHPLLDDGIIDGGPGSAFGRSLHYASAETQRWLTRPRLPRLGVAAFVDVARAARQFSVSDGTIHTDVGAGLRMRIPGVDRVLRIDAAHGLRDGVNAITLGWEF